MASSLREINILTRSLGGRRVKEKAGGEGREGGWPVEWRQKDVLVHICFLALRDGNFFFGGGEFLLNQILDQPPQVELPIETNKLLSRFPLRLRHPARKK